MELRMELYKQIVIVSTVLMFKNLSSFLVSKAGHEIVLTYKLHL